MSANVFPATWLGAGYVVNPALHHIVFTDREAGGDVTLPQLSDAQADPVTESTDRNEFATKREH